jgi:hypothetical protein
LRPSPDSPYLRLRELQALSPNCYLFFLFFAAFFFLTTFFFFATFFFFLTTFFLATFFFFTTFLFLATFFLVAFFLAGTSDAPLSACREGFVVSPYP